MLLGWPPDITHNLYKRTRKKSCSQSNGRELGAVAELARYLWGCQNILKIYIFNYGSVRLFNLIIIESILKILVIFCF